MPWITNTFAALNAVPYQVFCIMAVAIVLLALIAAGIVKLLLPKSPLAHYMLFLTFGAVFGFIAAMVPWVQHYNSGVSGWPILDIWPYWGRHAGPFSVSFVGVTAGLAFGWWVLKRNQPVRQDGKTSTHNHPAIPPQNPPPSGP